MHKINLVRWLVGGAAAGLLMFLADGFIHEKLLHEHWQAVMTSIGRGTQTEEAAGSMLYFGVHELLRGLALAWVYVIMRSHFGPGPKTAIIAGVAVWAIMFAIPFIAEVPVGIYSTSLLTMWAVYELVTTTIAGVVAGLLYKDAAAGPA